MQTTCVNCKADGKIRRRCVNCKRCLYHLGCNCPECYFCKKRVAPSAICKKCGSCTEHHTEPARLLQEFPLRACKLIQNCTKGHQVCLCGMCTKCNQKCSCATYILNPLPCSIGVELELANWGGFNKIQAGTKNVSYHFEHDGSVSSGQELVTEPMKGDQFIYGMTDIIKGLIEYSCKADKTCGYHVHVDALQYSALDLRRVMIGFWSIQNQLWGSLISKARATNIYCPPVPLSLEQILELSQLSTAGETNKWFYRYLYQLETDTSSCVNAAERLEQQHYIRDKLAQLKAHKYENAARRQAINFHSWMMRGTIEFRLKEGTTDPEDLLCWPLWAGWFVYKLGLMEDKEVFSWIKKPPTLEELTGRLALKGFGPSMPQSIVDWVTKKMLVAEKYVPKASPVTTGRPAGQANAQQPIIWPDPRGRNA